ncbi:MAG: hypothetical protein U0667_02330 [Chloroflexota bacterium]
MGDRIACPACGFQNEAGDEFCGQCGRYLGWSASGDAAAPVGPASGDTPAAPVPARDARAAGTGATPASPPVTSGWSGSYLAPAPPPEPQGPPQMIAPPVMGGVTCRFCGLANPSGRTFCQRCGNELDPAVGTVAGTPRPVATAASGRGGRRFVVAGIGLIAIAAVVGAAIVFGGALGGPSPTSTPRTARASGTPAATSAPTGRRTGEPTARPTATPRGADTPTAEATAGPTPRVTPRPTRTPTVTATPIATGLAGDLPTPPPAGTYLCDGEAVALEDPLGRGWNIDRVRWGTRPGFDHVYLELSRRRGLDGKGTRAVVQVLPVSEVEEQLGFRAPSVGRTAVVLTLSDGIRATLAVDQEVALPKVRAVTAGTDDEGRQWLALGVRGDTCYSLQAPAWVTDDPDDGSVVELVIDIQQ